MKKILLIVLCLTYAFISKAQKAIYQPEDSVKVVTLLRKVQAKTPSKKIAKWAEMLLATPYVAKTLEVDGDKHLIVNLRELDCTTFVENLVALAMTKKNASTDFQTFKQQLNRLRYRDGKRDGYISRLHYFSDWVANNTQKEIVTEYTSKISKETRLITLNFMSTHVDKYPMLKGNALEINKIKAVEHRWKAYKMPYIPTEALQDKHQLKKIKSGDIIGLVCSVKGLDVSHLGIAYWKNDELYLLDASMKGGKVMIEPENLYTYLIRRSYFKGIRVIRVNN
jgi:hypothetical protein